ncbi:hypothetical protein HH212_18640 [Massilia forsythiae]|uniref:Uncharacterized protein n=1 Tax=Massilia forsythiae TaxID=2728020 RepID=A0A7Z2ZV78_9BURK|nr:hypothetical protein [Massilia forsythiae]QJE01797.1 hypothetical protein HH212_18640 [Massilia forsythiae]
MLHPLASLWRHPLRVSFYESRALTGGGLPRPDGPGLESLAVRRRFASADATAAYLRYWLGEPAARAELQATLRRSGPSLTSVNAGADGWLRALATCIMAGSIVVVEEKTHRAIPSRLIAPSPPAADSVDDLSPLSATALMETPVRDVDEAPAVAATKAATPAAAAAWDMQADAGTEARETAATETAVDVQVAQAQVLEEAARNGTPFCEICEAARVPVDPTPQDREASTYPPSPADHVAQAETLEQAAQHGTPFCEICETTRRSAQQSLTESRT